jgi:hypothetical protein
MAARRMGRVIGVSYEFRIALRCARNSSRAPASIRARCTAVNGLKQPC